MFWLSVHGLYSVKWIATEVNFLHNHVPKNAIICTKWYICTACTKTWIATEVFLATTMDQKLNYLPVHNARLYLYMVCTTCIHRNDYLYKVAYLYMVCTACTKTWSMYSPSKKKPVPKQRLQKWWSLLRNVPNTHVKQQQPERPQQSNCICSYIFLKYFMVSL